MKRIYLDHNATTPMRREVLSAMLPYLTEEYGNASSIHAYGQNARDAVEQARASVARFLGARPADILFTSGGTESNNHAILGAVAAVPWRIRGSPPRDSRKALLRHFAQQGNFSLLNANSP